MDRQRILEHLLALCAVPSISGSESEQHMPALLQELLRKVPYFAAHPERVEIFPLENGAPGGCVFALLPAAQPTEKTILLLSHFDVVGVEEYGAQQALAFDPKGYTAFLKTGQVQLPAQAQADLDSGNFLFGRGVCDMKWGIAADLELLWHFCEHPAEQHANLLFVSVPDEECNSAGMLTAARLLLQYRQTHRLQIAHCVVSEPDISPEGGRTAHPLHVGAAGKLMPLIYCVGQETHVGEPFCGLNPNLLLSEITAQLELSPDLIDCAQGCYTPAPTCLKQSDLKAAYSVQTPAAAYAYFNVMTLTRTPEQLLTQLEALITEAFETVLHNVELRRAQAEQKLGRAVRGEAFVPRVLRYGELLRICRAAHGERFDRHMEAFLQNSATADLRQLTVETIREAHRFCPDRSPMVIVCFAPPYYPHSGFLDGQSGTLQACRALICGKASELGEALMVDHCFNGLTDMCYLSLRGQNDLDALRESFPVWGTRYAVPLEEIRALNIPFVNFGPLGRDPHKFTERVDLAYSFEKAPVLLLELIQLLSVM